MKPHLLTITAGVAQSFSARRDIQPDVNNHWHYHEEMELIYIKKGSGSQFIGDNISAFSDGDVVLVGSNMPHYWQFDTLYFSDSVTDAVEVYVVHFKPGLFGAAFLGLPENNELARVIEQSARGIQIKGRAAHAVAGLIEKVVQTSGTRKLLTVIESLIEIHNCTDKQYLVSLGFRADFQETEKNRLQSIFNYSTTHYKRKIELKEVAALIKLTESAFCKFFKAKTGKTYSAFVNEIRVGQACRLLIEGRLSIKEICFECGFYNLASFHKCFRDLTNMTPLKYQKHYN
jgi:AraC-like DNA-binding protein